MIQCLIFISLWWVTQNIGHTVQQLVEQTVTSRRVEQTVTTRRVRPWDWMRRVATLYCLSRYYMTQNVILSKWTTTNGADCSCKKVEVVTPRPRQQQHLVAEIVWGASLSFSVWNPVVALCMSASLKLLDGEDEECWTDRICPWPYNFPYRKYNNTKKTNHVRRPYHVGFTNLLSVCYFFPIDKIIYEKHKLLFIKYVNF